ncbi:hypothetical protein HYT17_00390 [Candidatus Microgenomates bacterium]|nr:hypothetical protein [Candidatus Microgenomates bacterium]
MKERVKGLVGQVLSRRDRFLQDHFLSFEQRWEKAKELTDPTYFVAREIVGLKKRARRLRGVREDRNRSVITIDVEREELEESPLPRDIKLAFLGCLKSDRGLSLNISDAIGLAGESINLTVTEPSDKNTLGYQIVLKFGSHILPDGVNRPKQLRASLMKNRVISDLEILSSLAMRQSEPFTTARELCGLANYVIEARRQAPTPAAPAAA